MTDAAGHPDLSRDVTLTPLDLIAKLGVFDLDPCGYPGHATARHVVTLPTNGLHEKWVGRVWLNPPYSNPTPWLEKMADHSNGIAMVLASTDTAWFHDFVVPFAEGATATCVNSRSCSTSRWSARSWPGRKRRRGGCC
jgi:hypothetical protein